MKTDVLFTITLYLVLAIFCLIGLVIRHSASEVFTKKLLMYAAGAMALAAGLGAAFARSESLVTVFYWLEGLSLLLGIAHVLISRKLFSFQTTGEFWSELLLTGAVLFLIAGAFTGLFQGLQRSDTLIPALASGLLPFLLPLLFLYAYAAWVAIQPRIYRKWFYPVERPVPLVELDNTLRLNFMVTKRPDAPVSNRFTVTLPADRSLDELFQFMIYSHNHEEDPEHPILYYEDNTEGTLLGWIFYRESWGGWIKTYYDPSLSLLRNGLKTDDTIIAKSFSNQSSLS